MVNSEVTIVVVIMVFAMFAMMVIYAMGYKTVPPNQAMVEFRGGGDTRKTPPRFIAGGGRFILPGARSNRFLDLTIDLIELELNGVKSTSHGDPITFRVKVAVLWKITTDPDILKATAGGLVERTRGENQMAVKERMELAIRNAASSMSAEAFEMDRDVLSAKIQHAASDLVNELGLEIRSLHILNLKI